VGLPITTAQGEEIYRYHALGLLNREIAAAVGCHHNTVGVYLRKAGLTTNLPRGRPAERVDDDNALCRLCNEVRNRNDFPLVRNSEDGDRLSICRSCHRLKAREATASNPAGYFASREARMRRGETGTRLSRANLTFALPDGYLMALWSWQRGLCFYTDSAMHIAQRAGYDPASVSIDRVDPSRAYVVGNVVLCMNRINSIKQNVTLDEMAEWMPGWHRRILDRLPLLRAEVSPIPDDWPRSANGRRLPAWVVERRRRIQQARGGRSD
jgi:hypothetical protein